MANENNWGKCLANLVFLTISIGFLIGGGISYAVYDHECKTFVDQCDEKQRYTAFIIMCVGGAFTALNCACLLCICAASFSFLICAQCMDSKV